MVTPVFEIGGTHYNQLNCNSVEICDNAIDDDGDGLIDLNDGDCECNEIQSLESLIPNASFEETDCCPQMQSELNCAEGWIQASAPTTDFIHMCGWLGWDGQGGSTEYYPPPMPFPDGNGIVGFRDGVTSPPGNGNETGTYEPNWKEYAGACLTGPMLKDSLYRIEFDIGFVNRFVSPSLYVTIFGTPDCEYLPFGPSTLDDLVGCPTNTEGWTELGNVYVFGGDGNKWVHSSIEFIPEEDINAIAIGPNCTNNLVDRNLYYFLDNLILNEARSFEFEVVEEGHPCSSDFSLSVNDYLSLDYQWYLDGIALIGETGSQLSQNYGEGFYQVRIDDGTDCTLLNYGEVEIPVESGKEAVSICEADLFEFGGNIITEPGIYYDTILSVNGCDSIIELNLSVEDLEVDTFSALTYEGIAYEFEGDLFDEAGEYVVTILTEEGCEKEVLFELGYYEVYVPNSFTPDSPGINDTFTIFTSPDESHDFQMYIYDKWGNLIFTGKEWNGHANSEPVLPGVYTYLIEFQTESEASKYLAGSLTLFR